MKKLRRAFALLLSVMIMVSMIQPGITITSYASAEKKSVSIETTLKDGSTIRSSKKTFSVIARDAQDNKVETEVTFDGDTISPSWNDSQKSSYTLNFTGKEDGIHTVIVSADEESITYQLTYKKAEPGECIGYAVMDVEAFTISKGFIIEPVLVPVIEGENAAQALKKLIESNGYGLTYTGSLTSGFYMSGIYGSNYSGNKDAKKELDLSGVALEKGVAENIPSVAEKFDATDGQEGWLGEFCYNYMSGWMYCANGLFPNVGYADYYIEPGDVLRTQFTVYYGGEIGGSSSLGGGWDDAYAVADKDKLLTVIATINSSANVDKLKGNTKIASALEEAYEVLQDITVSQNKVDAATKKLQELLVGDEAGIKGISLNQEAVTMEKDQQLRLQATVDMDENSTIPVHAEWTSSNNSVVTVSDGTLTAVKPGTANITVSYKNFSATCTVTVAETPLTDIVLSKSKESILKGKTTTLTVSMIPSNTSDDTTVEWKSSDETVAKVSQKGVVTGVASGTAIISATVGSYTKQCQITVEEHALEKIQLSKATTSLTVKKNVYLNKTVFPSNQTDGNSYSWTSDNTNVATVTSSGRVTAKAAGTAVITCQSVARKNVYDTCVVKVVTTTAVAAKSISMEQDAVEISNKESRQLTATVLPQNQTDPIVWKSSDDKIVSVSQDGVISGKKAGKAVITAYVGSYKASCTVTVKTRYTNYPSDWPDFRNGADNLGITNAATPKDAKTTELLWAKKIGVGFGGNAVSTPILVDGYLICMQGKNLLKYNAETGEPVLDANGNQVKGTMVGSSPYNIISPTYANGMIFVGLSGGVVQAFNAETLESLWVYKDSLGGQPNSPITYSDGYVYTGFWNAETKDANFVCISVDDEDTENTTEEKKATWKHAITGGFYWAGAYVNGDYVYVGTDDGTSYANSATAKVMCYNKRTGEEKDSLTNIVGDVRSSISYDKTSGRIYFTTKAGYLYSVKIDAKGGFLKDTLTVLALGGASTSTPSIYNGRLYVGVSGPSQFGTSGHAVKVVDLLADGTMQIAYSAAVPGYPQTSGTISTAYVEKEGYAYVYFTYNYTPGGIYVLKDKPGQTEAIAEEIYRPTGAMAQYCICSVIADSKGVLYYKNDSGYMMAVRSNKAYLENVSVTGGNAIMDKGVAFNPSETKHEIVVDQGTKSVQLQIMTDTAAGVTAQIDGKEVNETEVTLKDGTATVTVNAVCGNDTKKYEFTIREKSSNANASVLRVNASNSYTSSVLTSTPAFNANNLEYTVKYTGTNRFINVWADTEDKNATVQVFAESEVGTSTKKNADGSIPVTATNSGYNRYAIYFTTDYAYAKVKVVVSAEDGLTKKEYVVTINRTTGTITPSPEVTATPEVTETPAVTTEPAVTTAPAITTAPAVTTEPAVTATPVIPIISPGYTWYPTIPTQTPSATSTPILPAETENPAMTEVPSVTKQPEITETPSDTEAPIATILPTPGVIPTPEITMTPTVEPVSTTTPDVVETPVATTGAGIEDIEDGKLPDAPSQRVSKVSIKKKASIYVNQTAKLKTVITPKTASQAAIVWKSSNKKVVKISKTGKITGMKKGTAIVVATVSGTAISAKCKVTVKTATLKVKKSKFTYKKNKTIGWSRIVKLVKGDKITSCKISNKKVLTKTKAGVLKMKRAGKVKITIRTKFGARKTIRLRLKK